MFFDELRSYCLSKKGVEETLPFDEETLVFKVMGKMFALTSVSDAKTINLKCNPERAIELRAQFPDDIAPGFHMSKVHWNTVQLHGRLSDSEIYELIGHSYDLVVAGLPKKVQAQLKEL
ncbi:MmcQ/YjbR family DNA-binding protein [bacterium]|nr:MmcQ/YjbR family DNA-binding protein [bacterium]